LDLERDPHHVTDIADALTINRAGWNTAAARFYGGTALPTYGPLAPTESTLGLLGPLAGTRVLELGCGSGHSLRYVAERGAAEMWGLDLSSTQIAFAADVLQPFQPRVHLFESPMEVNPGLPIGYFDIVLSIYALGWTTDLPRTLALVAEYLRPGGYCVFSGEHPVFGCLRYADQQFVFAEPYAAEGPTVHDSWSGVKIVIQRRKLSTFINEVVRAGLQVEALIEGDLDTSLATAAHADPARWYSIARAQLMPTTFIVKARKAGESARPAIDLRSNPNASNV
jgi:SAM-dependent methyltransferase